MNPESAQSGRVAGIILASGLSRRFGRNKLVLEVDGVPVIRRVCSVFLAARLHPVLVVLGHEAEQVAACLHGLPLALIHNPDFEEGQSRSLVRGVAGLPPDVAAAVIGVGDQPYLTARTVEMLVDRWRRTGAPVVYPLYGGERSSPTLFDRTTFPYLLQVTGDEGGRGVIRRFADRTEQVEAGDAREGIDIDTPEQYEDVR